MYKFLFALFCAVPFLAFPQSNYKTGSVIIKDGSVLPGFINYREWDENPKSIQFKNNLSDSSSREFTAYDLKSFLINGLASYVSYTGTISMNHINYPDLPIGMDTSSARGTIFLKQIAAGQYVSLYSYTDFTKTRYFIQEKQMQPFELPYQYYYDSNSHSQIKKAKSYTGYLINIIDKYRNSDASLLNAVERQEYNLTLVKLINKINGDNTAANKDGSAAAGLQFYAGLAYILNILTLHHPYQTEFKKSYSAPVLNFGFDILSNKTTRNFFVRADASLSYYKIDYSNIPYGFDVLKVTDKYSADAYNLSLTPTVGWHFYNTDNLKFYIAAGYSAVFTEYANKRSERYIVDLGTYPNSPFDFPKIRLGIPVQVGALLNKKYEIFASYAYTHPLKDYKPNAYEFSVKSNTIALGLHLLLGR